ncbi:MAG: D-alanyl-D-alanine carboxypeptidase [Ruminococcus sp.]|jgi:D-alanyl-D-alanine carboxypeptidase (penicillin-binding protein 5/6)|nr:D-alanyl-D-alanine carboxypeptidase [Ruminococcus sp.]
MSEYHSRQRTGQDVRVKKRRVSGTQNSKKPNLRERELQSQRQKNGSSHNPARKRKRRRKNPMKTVSLLASCLTIVLILGGVCFLYYQYQAKRQPLYAALYETEHYNQNLYQGSFFAQDLCVASENVALDGFGGDTSLHAAGLFDVEQKQVLYADRVYAQLYPASTTKLMTAYLTLKYGNLEEVVTVTDTAVAYFEPEATLCGLQAGDQLTLYDLLCGLVLASGNDNAVVIAEHLSGSVEGFAEKMNQEALALGATHSHFMNPHGLHEEDHYTTAYDLYLIFNECIKDSRFLDIIAMKSYVGTLTGADGSVRTAEWTPTNYYSAGLAESPPGVQVIGGKTGTTDQAGSCVVLYNLDSAGKPFISIVMGAGDKEILYQDMTQLLAAGVGS